jgi:quinol monooxygenase YgiN
MAVPFIQIIEMSTSRIDEVEAAVSEWREKTVGKRTAQRGTLTSDRDAQNRYVQIVEFPSFEAAMANSELPETAALAEKLAALSDGPAAFRNLDVVSVQEL